MKISLIAAVANNNIIGYKNTIPWYIKSDLARFKSITNGKSVVFGRKTFESINKKLTNRRIIVVSRNVNLQLDDCIVVNSISDALQMCVNEDEVIIAGGQTIYESTIHLADSLYISFINQSFLGDTYFPHIDKNIFKEVYFEHVEDVINYKYSIFERK